MKARLRLLAFILPELEDHTLFVLAEAVRLKTEDLNRSMEIKNTILKRLRGLKGQLIWNARSLLFRVRRRSINSRSLIRNIRPTVLKVVNSNPAGDFRLVRPTNEQAIKEAYQKSALAKDPDTFAFYRIIGNDLSPRHLNGQSYSNLPYSNLRFILENEPSLQDCTKFWVVNRIFEPEVEKKIIELLKEHDQEFIHIPFVAEDYEAIPLDIDCLPHPDYLTGGEYLGLAPNLQMQVKEALFRLKNLYVMNCNTARNVALNDGRRHAKWVLPWDGNCFVTTKAWENIRRSVVARAHLKYFAVPLDRVTDNQILLASDYIANPIDEPQLLFRRDSTDEFDEKFPYGRRPKVELFWRLGIPGPWDDWRDYPWDLPRSTAYSETIQFGVAGWVSRLSSGNYLSDQTGRKSGSTRAKVRRLAILKTINELDRSLTRSTRKQDGTTSSSLLQMDDLKHTIGRTEQSDILKNEDRQTNNIRTTLIGSTQPKIIDEWLEEIDNQVKNLPELPPDGQLEVAFLISMRSKLASRDWDAACDCLSKTLRTVFAQSDQNYRVLIAGHEKPDIPELNSEKVTWVSVSLVPPSSPHGFTADKNAKRRELGFLLGKIGFEGFVMPLDADDWIHYRLVEFIRRSGEKVPTFFSAGFLCNLEEKEVWIRPGTNGKRPFFMGCGSGAFFYFKNSDFPSKTTIRSVKKVKFLYAVSSHVTISEKLLDDKVSIRRVQIPMITWVLGHVNSNSTLKGRNTNLSPDESLQTIGTLFRKKFAYHKPNPRLHVLAHRTDGMGERLRSLIQAMHVADSLGCDYRFTWGKNHLMARDNFHPLPTASNMFSSDFLDAHLSETNFDADAYQILEYRKFLRGRSKEEAPPGGPNSFLLQGQRTVSIAEIPQELESSNRYRIYFDQIRFSSHLMKAVHAAQSVRLSSTAIAFHVRGGDIVFSSKRERPRFMFKVVPLPLAISFAKELIAEGNTVLVFSEDSDSIKLMENIGAVTAISLTERQSETSTQADLFDMVLMSRCSKIYASHNSAFANLATLIGSAELINPIRVEKPKKILRRIDVECQNHLDCSTLLISQAYKLLYYGFGGRLSKKDRDHSLARAMEFDPENRLYSLTKAANLMREGRIQAADNVLLSLFENDFKQKKKFPLPSMQILDYFAGTEALLELERNTFVDNVGRGFAYVDIYAAYVLYTDALLDQAENVINHSPLLKQGHPIAKKFQKNIQLDRDAIISHDAN